MKKSLEARVWAGLAFFKCLVSAPGMQPLELLEGLGTALCCQFPIQQPITLQPPVLMGGISTLLCLWVPGFLGGAGVALGLRPPL